MTSPIKHGTIYAHQRLHCRCADCRKARSTYDRTRERRIGYGTWKPLTDAEPVRQHIAGLMAKDATLRSIAAAAEYDHGSLGRIMWGRANQPAPRQIRTEIAERILAVTLLDTGISPRAEMDATGTHRRIRALHATGRPLSQIERDFGYKPMWMIRTMRCGTVSVAVAAHVAARYEALKGRDPLADGVRPQDVAQSKRRAAALGWHGPQMWDHDIDDPAADPLAPEPSKPRPSPSELTRAERMAITKSMTLMGASAPEIAERIGRDERTVFRWRRENNWTAAA